MMNTIKHYVPRYTRKTALHIGAWLLCLLVFSPIASAQCPDVELQDGLIDYEQGKNDILKSVGRWIYNCTAVFVHTSDDPNAPAYVLSNGHCVYRGTSVEPTTVRLDFEDDDAYIQFNYFDNTVDETIIVDVERIEYATMKDLDLAVARLDKTVGEMRALGLEPIKISQENPQIGDDVKIVGIPSSLTGASRLRLTSCSLTGSSPLVLENGWVWRDMFENECANIIPGSSGSPVFSCYDDGLYALINTTNADYDFPCEIASPCEVNGLREDYDPGTNYALDIRHVVNCFNAQGVFDTTLPNFPLDLGNQMEIDYTDMIFDGLSAGNQINPDISGSTDRLEVKLSGKSFYRYKFVSLDVSSPWDLAGYGQVISRASNPIIDDTLPDEEGIYFLSIIAGDSPDFDDSWQLVDHASVIPFIIDKVGPPEGPDIFDKATSETNFEVLLVIPSGFHLVGYKASGDVNFDENDLSQYSNVNIGEPIIKARNGGPFKVCGYTTDGANNRSPVNCKIFGGAEVDADGDGNSSDSDQDDNNPCTTPREGSEVTTNSSWARADCDGDGVPNGHEVDFDEDNTRDEDATDPYNACSLDLSRVSLDATDTEDCDGDGVTNADEINTGNGDERTDPNDPCDYNTNEQSNPSSEWEAADCDGDGNPNAEDPNPHTAIAQDDIGKATSSEAVVIRLLDNDDFVPTNISSLTRVPNSGNATGVVLFNVQMGILSYTPTSTELADGSPITLDYEVCKESVCATASVTILIEMVGEKCPINAKANLEGSLIDPGLRTYASEMRNDINTFGLLPGQTPKTGFGKPTPKGQPYNNALHNYQGTEGDTMTQYPSEIVDWVLVELRSTPDNADICRQAAVINQSGDITFLENCACDLQNGDQVHITIHHRNHLAAMSPLVTVTDDAISYDFTTLPAYSTGFNKGTKQLEDGTYVMFGGNSEMGELGQLEYNDINANDFVKWRNETAFSDVYIQSDLNMDADVNSNDKILLILNNGTSTSITN